jgi:hypothetical protein
VVKPFGNFYVFRGLGGKEMAEEKTSKDTTSHFKIILVQEPKR